MSETLDLLRRIFPEDSPGSNAAYAEIVAVRDAHLAKVKQALGMQEAEPLPQEVQAMVELQGLLAIRDAMKDQAAIKAEWEE